MGLKRWFEGSVGVELEAKEDKPSFCSKFCKSPDQQNYFVVIWTHMPEEKIVSLIAFIF